MKIINFEIVKNTDFELSLKATDLDLTTVTFKADLMKDNEKTCSFTFVNQSASITLMKLSNEITDALPIGIHKGDLLLIDATSKVRALCKFEAKVLINRTEIV